jgi:hypothetical protein
VGVVPAVGVVVGGMVTAVAVAIAGMVSVMAVHVADVLLTLQMGHGCLFLARVTPFYVIFAYVKM